MIFNYLIGNAAAHGKNFALLHEKGKPRQAPAYDLLSTSVYPSLSPRMAMKIGGKYAPDEVHLRHWLRLVPDSATARNAMEKNLMDMARNTMPKAIELKSDLEMQSVTFPIFDAILAIIKQRSESALKRRD